MEDTVKIEIEPTSPETAGQRYWYWAGSQPKGTPPEILAERWARHEALRIRDALFTLKGFGHEHFYVAGENLPR